MRAACCDRWRLGTFGTASHVNAARQRRKGAFKGIAAGVLNATRQTGSVLGVALFGSLAARENAFITGARESLIISAILLLGAAITIVIGGHNQKK
ncbi:MAG: hypothetical protein WAK31_17955 [Chthoniobacterales bacterium]